MLVEIPDDGHLTRTMIGMQYLGTPGEVIRQALDALSLRGVASRQVRMGKMLGVSQRTVSNWFLYGPAVDNVSDRTWSFLVRLIMSPTDRTPLP